MGCCCAKCYGDDDDESREHLISPSGTAGYQSLGKTAFDSKLELFDHSSVKVESVDNRFKQLTAEHNALVSDWNKLEETRNNLTKGDREIEQNLDKIFHHWRDREELPQVQIDHPNGNLTLINYSLEQITKEQQEMLDHFNKLSRLADKLMKTCPKLMQDMDTVIQEKISIEEQVGSEVSGEQQVKSLSNLKAIFENLNIMRLNTEQVKAHTMMTCDRLRNAARVLEETKAESGGERDEHQDAAAAVSEGDGESGIEMKSEHSDVEGTHNAVRSPSEPAVAKPDEDTPVGVSSPYSLNFDQQTSQEDQVDKGDAADAVKQKPADTGQGTSESDEEQDDRELPHSRSSTISASSTEKAGTSPSSHPSDSSSGRHYTSTDEESTKDETGSEGKSPQDQDVIPGEEHGGVIRDETAHPDRGRHDDSVTDIDTEHPEASATEPQHETSADETLPTDQSRSDDTVISADITDVTDVTDVSLDVTPGDDKRDDVPDSHTEVVSESADQQTTEETHQEQSADEKASDSLQGDDKKSE